METTQNRVKILVIALLALLFMEFLSAWAEVSSTQQSVGYGEDFATLQISDLHGKQSLGEAAVMVEQQSDGLRVMSLCTSLPNEVWLFLIGAYLALLIFNFKEAYKQQKPIGGVFEIFLSGMFLILWASFDNCHSTYWFPLLLLKSGLIVYIFAQLLMLYTTLQPEPEEEQNR
jgi:RsiW-degrading membrane proteinase PrsW (M82 family)